MPHASAARATALIAIAALAGCAAAPSDTDFAAANLPARVELEHVPFHPQTRYQCGPAALATMLNASGVQTSPEELSPEIYLPGKKGSLQVELIATARARDRVVYPLATDLSSALAQVAAGHPVLVLQNLGLRSAPAWHFAVIVGYDRDARELILRSGSERRLTVNAPRFLRTWDRAQRWAVIVLKPEQLPAQPKLRSYIAAAAALEATGRLEAAGVAYATAQAQWPDSIWPVLGLANISHARGDASSAERRYEQALALDPDHAVAHNNLAELLDARGCAAAARMHIARAIELAKATTLEPSVLATAQRIVERNGQNDSGACPAAEDPQKPR